MGKGASPLRLLVRNSPKGPAQEHVGGISSNGGRESTPPRLPMSSISEIAFNQLALQADLPSADDLTPQGKKDPSNPRGKTKSHSLGQCLFPQGENLDCNEVTAAGTPGKQIQHSSAITPVNGKSKNTLLHRSGLETYGANRSPLVSRALKDITPTDKAVEVTNTPPRKPSAALAEVIRPASVNAGASGQAGAGRAGGGSGSAHGTPRTQRSGGGLKPNTDAETGAATRSNASEHPTLTPVKNVTRALKFGASPGNVASGTGLSSTRATGSSAHATGSLKQGSQHTMEQCFELVEDPSFWKEHNVQVIIRTRPISNLEMASEGFSRCLKHESPHTITWLGQPESRFTFDHVAGESVTQEKLFKVAGLPMVENCMAGYNSCMFAYGQTGSGKTHTMLGDINNLDKQPNNNQGMTPRVFEYLFGRIQKEEELRKEEQLKFTCRCSFLEIYNEQITDLLEPSSTNLQMREDTRKGVYVENLSEVEVHCVQDVIHLLIQGAANRRVAATNMNRESSRSHSVFTCITESKWESNSMTNIRFSQLNLVDLAGSERQKASGAEGERLKEAASINRSLSTLGLVIMILVDVANGKQRHVPYRDSKLTFLLQDSLGGNSKTTMIATVSPSSCNALETLSTLKFAQRAKLIHNTAVINEDASVDVKALRLQIQRMKEELDRLREQSAPMTPGDCNNSVELGPPDCFGTARCSCDPYESSRALGSPTISNKQMRVLVAGALRREKAADAATQKLTAEIEQLNRLVQQYEEDTKTQKMILSLREDKIQRLESLAEGLLSVESNLAEEKKVLVEELRLVQGQIDGKPELTKFAIENMRILGELRSLQDFHDGGEREIMAEEIINLRDQLLEVLDGKIVLDQGLLLMTPQNEKASVSELAAATKEKNGLLHIEADNYGSELEECRCNLKASCKANANMLRQVVELQVMVEQLKAETVGQENQLNKFRARAREVHRSHAPTVMQLSTLEAEQAQHLKVIADLKIQLQQSEERAKLEENLCGKLDNQLKEALQEAHDLQKELQETKEALGTANVLIKRLQSAEKILAVEQDCEMRGQLEEVHSHMEKPSSKEGTEEIGLGSTLEEREECQISNPSTAKGGSQEPGQRTQEIELRHAEEVMQLHVMQESLEAALDEEQGLQKELERNMSTQGQQGLCQTMISDHGGEDMHEDDRLEQIQLELESMQDILSEERAHRKDLEERNACLSKQLQESVTEDSFQEEKSACLSHQLADALCKLNHEKAIVEALESQQLFSISELESLEVQHDKLIARLKRREERDNVLKKRVNQLEWELMKEKELRELERELELKVVEEEGGVLVEVGRSALEAKLEKTKMELEMARGLNVKFQGEQTLQKAMEQEMDVSRTQAETETVLAITCLQSELLKMRDEVDAAIQGEGAAKERLAQLAMDLESANLMLQDVEEESLQLKAKYEGLMKERDADIQGLQTNWETATARLIDYLTQGDNAKEMGNIVDHLLPPKMAIQQGQDPEMVARGVEKRRAMEFLQKQLQQAPELPGDTEGKVHEAMAAEARPVAESRMELELEESFTKVHDGEHLLLAMQSELHCAQDKPEEMEEKLHLIQQKDLEQRPTMLKSFEARTDLTDQEMLTTSMQKQFEQELEKVVRMVSETEKQKDEAEEEWRRERVRLVAERQEAKMYASQKDREATSLLKRFEDSQATLREAEMLMNALVHANESAKFDVRWWKIENENQQKEKKKILLETMRVLAMVKEEIDLTMVQCEAEIGSLAADFEMLRVEMKQDLLQIPVAGYRHDLMNFVGACRDELNKVKDEAEKNISDVTDKLRTVEGLLQETLLDVSMLQAALDAAQGALQSSQVKAHEMEEVIKADDKTQASVAELLASIAERDSHLSILHSQFDQSQEHLVEVEKTHLETVSQLEAELAKNIEALGLLKQETICNSIAAAHAKQEASEMKEHIVHLQSKTSILEAELEVKADSVNALEAELLLVEHKMECSLENAARNLKGVEMERDTFHTAHEAAEICKIHAEGREEVSSLGVSVAHIAHNLQEALSAKKDMERRVEEMGIEMLQMHTRLENLQYQCEDKDVQIQTSKAWISDLTLAVERQVAEYQQRLKALECVVEQAKVEDQRLSSVFQSTPKTSEKTPKSGEKMSKSKGPGSPFKCIGLGMSHQMNSELDAELYANQRRIEELETLAAARQKEVFMLNKRLVESESMTRDIVRNLHGLQVDTSNYALSQQKIAESTHHQDVEILEKEEEINNLQRKLNDFIKERESWLEQINQRQGEVVAAQMSAEKLRQHDQSLAAENERLKVESTAHQKRIGELEQDVKNLSGQQNLQQRIHHHAKIKEENTGLRLQNGDLSAKLRRTQNLFARVNDELARYRAADGKTSIAIIEEDQCLRSKLKNAEDKEIQLAQTITSLCTGIMKVAGISQSGEVNHSLGLKALKHLEDRLLSTEQELSQSKIQTRIEGERKRLSDREGQSLMEPTNFQTR